MKIEANRMVSLTYELREGNSEGRIIETLDDTKPLNFLFGSGRLLPVFEENIGSLNEGDNFSFSLNPEMAYGERREEMIVNVPINVFETDGKLNEDICKVGNEVPMTDTEGNSLVGVINEITDQFVTMDFNHPMAGLDLFFTGKIVGVREATEEELAQNDQSCSACGGPESNSGCGCC